MSTKDKKKTYQSDLHSFFGGGGAQPKKRNPQTKIDSFFGNGRQSSSTATASEEKENTANKRKNETEVADTKKSASSKEQKKRSESDSKRRRRVIEDDSSSDENESMEEVQDEKEDTKPNRREREEVEKPITSGVNSEPTQCKEVSAEKAGANGKSSAAKSTKSLGSASSLTDGTKQAEVSLTYADLCVAFEEIESITGRLQIQDIMTKLFRAQIDSGNPENLYPLMYLCSNTVAPAYECLELGIGDAILVKAIAEAYGSNIASVKKQYDELGDLGQVAQSFKGKQRTLGGFFNAKDKAKPLGCLEVLTTFREIAKTKGNQSQKWKTEKIKKMLVRAMQTAEPKYIIRGLQGKLRIGLAQLTVLISLAHALALSVPPMAAERKKDAQDSEQFPQEAKEYLNKGTSPEKRLEAAVAIVKKAYSEVPSYDALLDAALKEPLHLLHKACSLKPGIPVSPMLAKPTKSIQEVLKRLNGMRFTCEYKYDGERAQVHILADGTTYCFSRNLLNTSDKFPEVPLFVKEAMSDEVSSAVLDAEVVAYNNKTEQLVPFQVLSTRKKTEESAESAKVQIIVQAFDLMYLNGESLLGRTLQDRRDLLHQNFSAVQGKFTFATSLDHEDDGDTTKIEEFLDKAVKGQCEGLMVKTLDVNAIYEPSRRSLNWLKLKKDYLEGLGDSVDLVPLGAYHGRGKRTGVYGAYLLACYDPDTEEFQSVCKIGTGFSDEDLKSLSESLNKHVIPQKSSQFNVSEVLNCDVWFDCVQVWEVKAADLSKSPAHRGAEGKTGEEGRGIGLRFPRFVRLRDDKKPCEATTADQILEMYYNQDSIVGGDENDDADNGI